MEHWTFITDFRFLAILACAGFAWQTCYFCKRMITREIQARLEERERIASELHDTLLQGIFGLTLSLQTSVDRLEAGNPVRADIVRAIDRSDVLMMQGRERIRNLRSSQFTPTSLVAAFEAYGRQLQDASSVQFDVSVEGEDRPLNPIIQEEIILIGREALTNAFRHAGASVIGVELSLSRNSLCVRVHDNGCGVEPSVLQKGALKGHWGLPNMRARAEKLLGELDVKLRAEGGTQVDLRVPGDIVYRARSVRQRGEFGLPLPQLRGLLRATGSAL